MVYQKLPAVARVLGMDSLREQVVAQLRESILSGALPAGTKLRERAISEQLGVSRVPVREALMVLEAELLVEIVPRSGAVVTTLTRDEVQELFEVREVLEPLAARLAARHRTAADLEALGERCSAAHEAIHAGDDRAGASANADFHALLAGASGSGLLVSIMAPLQLRMERLFRRTIRGRAVELAEDHERLVEALLRRDEASAALLAQLHVTQTRAPSLALFED
ncbi:DNA-binding transcriptional regulator, GntR family [Propionibacterium cyclohexanicum]|uniref:DNA-binding transcriptional regulator, GntR family n=2 Tax=Propionibacterium cyclohexanicum TaxID=64702 RepID=A0A1H9SJI4_9ACTN|nr:DNA-binding transcriptional regulator, GntR family [Propionibacterium cyclohexanicum]